MKNADLHTHSYYSDGEFSPKEVVKQAKRLGIKHLALSDHNSIKGIPEAMRSAKKAKINLIPTVEVKVKGGEILGYFIDYKDKNLQKELKKISRSKVQRIKDRIKSLQKIGLDISLSKFEKKYPHAKDNYEAGNILYYFHEVLRMPIEDYYGFLDTIKSKKIKSTEPTMIQGIKLIKKYGGVPVLAHPWIGEYTKEFRFTEKNIKKLAKAGLKGLEVNNDEGYRYSRTPAIVKKIRKLAKKYNLIITSGSDYHGTCFYGFFGNYHRLGKCNCDEKVVNQLKNLKENGQS